MFAKTFDFLKCFGETLQKFLEKPLQNSYVPGYTISSKPKNRGKLEFICMGEQLKNSTQNPEIMLYITPIYHADPHNSEIEMSNPTRTRRVGSSRVTKFSKYRVGSA